jgi:protein-disulfide isomerase/uncharacterized membrane protein
MVALTWLLVSIGLATSAYLLFRSLALLAGDGAGAIDLCSRFFAAGCDAALAGPSSVALGIPLAGWGAIYFIVLAVLLLLPRLVGERFAAEGAAAAVVVAAAGVLISLWLSGTMLFGRAPFCPLCVVVHVANLALLPVLWRTSAVVPGRLRGTLAAGLRFVTAGVEGSPDTRWKALAFVNVALVAIVLHQWILIELGVRRGRAEALNARAIRQEFESAPRREIPVEEADPRLGPANAAARLVVFSSFQCPGCRTLSGILYDLRRDHGDRVSVVFKHFPMGTACNPTLARDLHPLACEAARAAEAARAQGRFWAYHDALFAAGWTSASDPALDSLAVRTELDLARFQADRVSAEVAVEVSRDIEAGNRLGVSATPTVFLNGRPVPRLGQKALEILVSDALQRAEGSMGTRALEH